MIIKPLPAYHGDCILISFPDRGMNRNVLIDTGPSKTYGKRNCILNKELSRIKNNGEFIDLLVITHIDDDHIAGALKMFGDSRFDKDLVKKVWFNSGELISDYFNEKNKNDREVKLLQTGIVSMSIDQGVSLENTLKSSDMIPSSVIKRGHIASLHNANIKVVSPGKAGLHKLHSNWETEKTGFQMLSGGHDDFNKPISELAVKPFKKDTSVPNGSSLALLFEAGEKKALLLGDAYPSVVEDGLRNLGYSDTNKLRLDVVKLSHHGSRKNTSPDLLKLLDCESYIVSTDGSRHGLPDKESIARVIHNNTGKNTHIYFNYKNRVTEKLFLPCDREEYSFDYDFIDPELGLKI